MVALQLRDLCSRPYYGLPVARDCERFRETANKFLIKFDFMTTSHL